VRRRDDKWRWYDIGSYESSAARYKKNPNLGTFWEGLGVENAGILYGHLEYVRLG
jgi:hypothetical protein